MGRRRQKKSQRKPSGDIGSLRHPPAGAVGGFERVAFPGEKAALEQRIVERYWTDLKARGLDPYESIDAPQQSVEDDFDFSVSTRHGLAWLELMEVAAFESGQSYESLPTSYFAAERADRILDHIARKSKRYGIDPATPLHLLLYSTDWRFSVSAPEAYLLAANLNSAAHPFASVIHYLPVEDDGGIVRPLFPTHDLRPDPAIHDYKRVVISHLDLSRPAWSDDGQSFEIAVGELVGEPDKGVRHASFTEVLRRDGQTIVVGGLTIVLELK